MAWARVSAGASDGRVLSIEWMRGVGALRNDLEAGLHAQLHGDLVGFAVIGFVETVEHAQDAVGWVAVVTGPLAEGHSALAEVLFDLLGCHAGGSCVEVVN